MATITTLSNPLSPTPHAVVRHMDNSNWTYTSYVEIDFAKAAAAKGSALAASDIIEAVRVPAGTIILTAWVEKSAALTGTVSAATINVGTAVSATQYQNGADLVALAVGSITPQGTAGAGGTQIITASGGDTVDIVLATLTGTLTGGKVKVGVLALDTGTKSRGVIAAPKS